MASSQDAASISIMIIILIIGFPNFFLRLRLQSFPLPNNNRSMAITTLRLMSSDSQLSYYNTTDRRPNQRLESVADNSGGSGDKQESSGSRIPDYDENERFKNSSRPPDSHYPADEQTRSTPSPPPQEESPPPQQQSPRSRIPDYDEYARFKDSSRPPDSHYPMGPGPKYRKRSGCYSANTNIVLVTCGSILSFCFLRGG